MIVLIDFMNLKEFKTDIFWVFWIGFFEYGFGLCFLFFWVWVYKPEPNPSFCEIDSYLHFLGFYMDKP